MTEVAETCESPKTCNQYRELISTLPRENGWGLSEHLYKYQGFWCPSAVLPGLIAAQEDFKPQPNDVILCSIPKSGTTWLKALAFAIVTRNVFNDSTNPLFMKLSHEIVPFLEHGLDHRDPKMPLLSTHIPYNSLPKPIIDLGCKLIFICRDPKDTFVSFWHYANKVMMSRTAVEEYSFSLDEAFELYYRGVSPGGPHWDNVLAYWKASLERPEKVLFLKYEDLKNDPLFHVKRMAKFLGHPFSLEEERQGLVEKIVTICSFENLSNLEVNKTGRHQLGELPLRKNSIFFRKGETGDWKNYLTVEMGARIDQITKEKFSGSGLD